MPPHGCGTSSRTHMDAPARRHDFVRRVIARLDVKHPQGLVKGIQLEGFRVLGDPGARARAYYADGIDELLYMDVVASLYERNSLADLVSATAGEVFVPLTVGGGIRSIDDIHKLLRAGADKVAINTAAIRRPELLAEAARTFGSQCIVLSVEAKRRPGGGWESYIDNGREKTGVDVLEWVPRACALGAGEVLVTSVDRDGTRKGFDVELIAALTPLVGVPLVAAGGAGSAADVKTAFDRGADAVAVGSLLHYGVETVVTLKDKLRASGIEVRR